MPWKPSGVLLLEVLTDNPGSIEVNKAYLDAYKQGLKAPHRRELPTASRRRPLNRDRPVPSASGFGGTSLASDCEGPASPPARRSRRIKPESEQGTKSDQKGKDGLGPASEPEVGSFAPEIRRSSFTGGGCREARSPRGCRDRICITK